MKPKKLTLSAWGPYAGCQYVNFETISDGLFLLTGPTGSGKTMIFDGISYALFGALSGKVRERDTLRSDFAKDSEETYVSLVFEHKGMEYTIIRHPRCIRKKKRGEGEITVNEKACLYMPDQTVIENLTAVNEKIKDILGVTHEQFKQIAMIAQGEFQELLIADSKKRVEIFRNIFGTEAAERTAHILSERSKALYSEIRMHKNRSDEAMASIISDGHDRLSKLLAEPVQNEMQISEALFEAVADDKKALKLTERQLQALEADETAAASEYKLYKEYEMSAQKEETVLLKLKASIEKNKAQLLKLQPEFDKLSERENALLKLQTAFEETGRLMKLLNERETIKTSVAAAALAAKTDKDHENRLSLALDKDKKTFDENKKAIDAGAGAHADVVKAETKVSENTRAIGECSLLIEQCRDFVRIKKIHAAKVPVYTAAQENADSLRSHYEAAELLRRQAAAGILAKMLKAGSPCPVCGSQSHPAPAKAVSGVVSEAQLKTMKSDSAAAEKEAQKLLNELTGLQKEKVLYWQNISRQAVSVLALDEGRPLVGEDGLFAAERLFYEAVQAEKEALLKKDTVLKNSLLSAKQKKSAYDELVKAQERLSQTIFKQENALKAAVLKSEASKAEFQKCEALLEDMNSRLPSGISIEDVVKEKAALERKISAETSGIKKVRDDYHSVGLLLASEEGQLQKSEEIVGKNKAQAAAVLEGILKYTDGLGADEWLLLKSEEIRVKKEARDKLYRRYHQNKDISRELKSKNEKMEKLKADYSVVKSLEDAARGNNSRRLEFEQYVLGAYFDEILAAANIRLNHMSEGRYELFRCEKVKDMRRRSSLDIEVLDNYTGRRRSVKTLSGGETFKAALSLALGLSDVIQSYVGGIDIDLLFIDEGFGSLDETSVQTAVDTLMDLAGGSRMVGIISHVSELKERIDTQIVVEKGVCGSIIK